MFSRKLLRTKMNSRVPSDSVRVNNFKGLIENFRLFRTSSPIRIRQIFKNSLKFCSIFLYQVVKGHRIKRFMANSDTAGATGLSYEIFSNPVFWCDWSKKKNTLNSRQGRPMGVKLFMLRRLIDKKLLFGQIQLLFKEMQRSAVDPTDITSLLTHMIF